MAGEWIALGKAIVDTGAAVASGFIESDKAKRELDAQIDIVNRKKDELKTNYNQSKLDLKNQYDQSKNNLNYNIGYTSMVRGQNAGFASQANVKNNQFMYEDLSMMIDQMAAAEGQAIQRASLTGFRKTGSQELGLEELERENQYQIDRAVETIKLSAAESYVAASDNYVSATAQIEQYRTNLVDLKTNYDSALASFTNQYNQQMSELNDLTNEQKTGSLDRERADAEYEWWEVGLDILTFGLAGAADVEHAYTQDQLNAMQSDFYAEQLAQYDKVDDKNVKRTSGTSISKPTYMQR